MNYPVTPAIRVLRERKIDFEPHVYQYLEKGGTKHSAEVLGVWVDLRTSQTGRRWVETMVWVRAVWAQSGAAKEAPNDKQVASVKEREKRVFIE